MAAAARTRFLQPNNRFISQMRTTTIQMSKDNQNAPHRQMKLHISDSARPAAPFYRHGRHEIPEIRHVVAPVKLNRKHFPRRIDDRDAAADALAALRERCEARGLAWLGGLAIGDAGLLPRMACRPRMGWARRRVSEAVDQLLIALLAGQSFGEQYVRPSLYARVTCRPR